MNICKRIFPAALALILVIASDARAQPGGNAQGKTSWHQFDMKEVLELSVADSLGQLRAVPVHLGEGQPRAFLAVYSESKNVDPWHAYFRFPDHTLKMILFTAVGKVLWRRDLGPGVVTGFWFCPVLPFDLNDDGKDEIWFVGNDQPKHPMSLFGMHLKRLDASDGKVTGTWPWPRPARGQSMGDTYRFFILGGYADGRPVLVTAQGTYGPMALQGWNPDMTQRWEHKVKADKGARGSHMSPVVDINNDDVDEILWGERALSVDTGEQLFVADEKTWNGHSDVILPLRHRGEDRWTIFTAREKKQQQPPRVVMYDAQGERLWSRVDHGHMDRGWLARFGKDRMPVAMAARIEDRGSSGEKRAFRDFAFKADTGEPYDLPYDKYRNSEYRSIPVDLNGDGWHEIIKDDVILDHHGRQVATIDGEAAMASKFMDHAGEQVLSWSPDGRVHVYADANAEDLDVAKKRYQQPAYQLNQQFTAVGNNRVLLGGL